MLQRLILFLVVFMLTFLGDSSAQVKTWSDSRYLYQNEHLMPHVGIRTPQSVASNPVHYTENHSVKINDSNQATNNNRLTEYTIVNTPAAANYLDRLGFFCRQELRLDKLTPMPIRFRLGSMEYVNYLEQKPNSMKPR